MRMAENAASNREEGQNTGEGHSSDLGPGGLCPGSRAGWLSYLKLCHLSPPFPLLWVRVTMESTSRGSCMEKLS